MLKRILSAALDLHDVLVGPPRPQSPVAPPAVAVAPRDPCDACGQEPTTDFRSFSIETRKYGLRVCAACARVAPTKVMQRLEDSIAEGRINAPSDAVYGT